MPFIKKLPDLRLDDGERDRLQKTAASRAEEFRRVQRAEILLDYAEGKSINSIMKRLGVCWETVSRCVGKALEMGVDVALNDLPRSGKPKKIIDEDKAWIVSLACAKPKEFGYAAELWTQQALAGHVKRTCVEAGRPHLAGIVKSTVNKILAEQELKPHKIRYYLERRDPRFEEKMAEVLATYREVGLINESGVLREEMEMTTLSVDEKPGIQAIANVAPDLPPVPGKYKSVSRDHEYKRLGTVSLLAGIDLHTGSVFGIARDRHRSREFIELLEMIDDFYPEHMRIRLILDNHSSHISKETRKWLQGRPGRFVFIFTPTHGSWLNLIERFFSKMARAMLRGIRVESKTELKERIAKWFDEINDDPVVFKWSYQPSETDVVY